MALGLLIPFYLAALTSQSALLLTLVGILLGCLWVNALSCKLAVQRLEPRIPKKTRWTEGEPAAEPWGMVNHSNHPVVDISLAVDRTPFWRSSWISSKDSSHAPFHPPALPRGEYPLGKIEVCSSHPFGLVQALRPLEATGSLIVHPRLPQLDSPPVSGHEAVLGGRQRGLRRVASGSQFAGVRPHQPGDALNQIHWKSSAKGLGMWVKSYEEELSGKAALLLDNCAGKHPARFEAALRAAGGLAFAALDAGHQVEWILLADGEPRIWTPFTDAETILDELARTRTQEVRDLADSLDRAVSRSSKRSALSLITSRAFKDLDSELGPLQSLGRPITIYCPRFDIDGSAIGSQSCVCFDEHGEVFEPLRPSR